MQNKNKELTLLAILTALSVTFSSQLKFQLRQGSQQMQGIYFSLLSWEEKEMWAGLSAFLMEFAIICSTIELILSVC